MDYQYEANGEVLTVKVEPAEAGYAVTVNGETRLVQATLRMNGELELLWPDGRRRRALVAADGEERWVALDPAGASGPVVLKLQTATGRARRSTAGEHEPLEAQMPGIVQRVLAAAGDAVERGQTLVLIEAMKMEIRVTAPHAGRVARVAVKEGQTVQRGQVLVEIGV